MVPIVIGALETIPKGLIKGLGILRNQRINYSIIEIGQNTEKGSGDLRRLAVSQNPVKDHQVTL